MVVKAHQNQISEILALRLMLIPFCMLMLFFVLSISLEYSLLRSNLPKQPPL